MKKVIFTLLALVCTMSMNAQIIKIIKDNTVVATYSSSEADCVMFEEEPSSEPIPDTPSAITGTAKRTGDIDVNWVQLWENGPKFAECNVGATSATEFGCYYAWGGSQDMVDDHNTGTVNLSGDTDTATKLWGSNWRMPTGAELQALLDKCDSEWTTVNSVNGYKFTGKGEYSGNSIFLPAAGYSDGDGDHQYGEIGFYWASTPEETESYYMAFSLEEQAVGYGLRFFGQSVRAVLAE